MSFHNRLLNACDPWEVLDGWRGDVWQNLAALAGGTTPFETGLRVALGENQIVIEADLPGQAPEDFEITYEPREVLITARKQEEPLPDGAVWRQRETTDDGWTRRIALPTEVENEQAEATYENGVLRLTAPIARRARSVQVAVRPG